MLSSTASLNHYVISDYGSNAHLTEHYLVVNKGNGKISNVLQAGAFVKRGKIVGYGDSFFNINFIT